MLEVILCGFMDRIRGDQFDLFSRAVEKLVYGWIIASILGHPFDYFTIYISIAFAFGISPGWGGPIGHLITGRPRRNDYESWEWGILQKNAWLALAFRGFLTGILLLPYFPMVSIAYIVAFPLAVYLGRFFNDPWQYQEYFRGWIAGLILWGSKYA